MRVYAPHVRLAGRQQKPYKGLFNQSSAYLRALLVRNRDPFLRHEQLYQFGPARSRNRRSERGPHHAKGTRYVGELFGRPVGSINVDPAETRTPV